MEDNKWGAIGSLRIFVSQDPKIDPKINCANTRTCDTTVSGRNVIIRAVVNAIAVDDAGSPLASESSIPRPIGGSHGINRR